ncbi:MAG: glycine--tRNA ligase subunit beta [Holosporales bacterium]|jgi:glycyl-tRNA synthetase beta chain|nr:glycine--tRNA ligase subunit beta [Holosporales bacterium]
MREELLLEIFSEEIPARLQKKAMSDAIVTFSTIMDDYNVSYGSVESFVSPRRLTLLVNNLQQRTKTAVERKRGPSVSAGAKAINGFLKSSGKAKENLIEIDGYYYVDIETNPSEVRGLIGDMISDFIANMPWQKSMRWYLEDQKTLSSFWIRPIRSILCVYDGSPVDELIKSVGLRTCSYTYGHRFLAPRIIEVSDFDGYRNGLEAAHVMIDYAKKRDHIDMEMTKKAADLGLCVMYDDGLLDEVAGLVEYPFVHIGVINEQFMQLPPEVLSTSMKIHQKYFTMTYPDSVIAPFYGVVTNIPVTEVMSDGLNRVLRARLSDASFFYKEDLDVTLEAFAQRLSNVVFHEKLGSMAQKIDRMMSIASTKDEHRATALCKADLLTQMVGEFPELQGTIGGIYAGVQDESHELRIAIKEHYKPVNATDTIPSSLLGARISFFDKIDSLVGLLGVGIKPTGSKDPFALRRTAIGIVKLLCESDGNILDSETLSWYIDTLITAYLDQGVPLDANTGEVVKEFLTDRFRTFVIDGLEVSSCVVDAVINSFGDVSNLDYPAAINKSRKTHYLTTLDGFDVVRTAYKRAIGIIGDTRVNLSEGTDVQFRDTSMIVANDAVQALYAACLAANNSSSKRVVKEDEPNVADDEDFRSVAQAAGFILEVCDKVLINDPDPKVRLANARLLRKFAHVVRDRIGDLTYVTSPRAC